MKHQLFKQSILMILGCFVFLHFSLSQNWEVDLLNKINPDQPNSNFQINISKSVYPLALATPLTMLTVGLIKKDKSLQQKSFKVIGTLIINTALTQVLKYAINRQRPYDAYPTIINPYNIETDASFPSGHTSTAFSLATTLSLQNKKWYVVLPVFAWASSVGYSRLYLGEHYPTDVLAGAAIGVGSAFLSNWLNKKILNYEDKKRNRK